MGHLSFLIESLRERLWVKPLSYALLAVGLVLAARFADRLDAHDLVPHVRSEVIEALVTIISASMLGVATFAVASMVSAYAAASRSTTPRAFSLLVKDRASQNALSSFIGAFIFSVVSIVAVKVGYYGEAGRFLLFVLSLAVTTWVVVTFVRWVDKIARLGRLGNTMDRVEEATARALDAWGPARALGGVPLREPVEADGLDAIHAARIGYVQHVDVPSLQRWASAHAAHLAIASPPGALVTPSRPLLAIRWDEGRPADLDAEPLRAAFVVADARTFAQDPRLGLISMSEIASRALSPGVNDPGTAIEALARLVKVFGRWKQETLDGEAAQDPCERVAVPVLDVDDLFEDAYAAIARDGAGCVEVAIRFQKTLAAVAALGPPEFATAAERQARLGMARSARALDFEPDLERLRAAASLAR